jgi:tRNA modification GTPase
VLHEHVSLDGMPLHLTDTAGLRESGDAVEQEGVRRAWREIKGGDQVLLLVDSAVGLAAADERILEDLPAELPVTVVYNKIDLTGQLPALDELDGRTCLWLSAKTGAGIELLRRHLKEAAGFESAGEDSFSARRRHLDALKRTREHLGEALTHAEAHTGELLAEELRLAQLCLSEITGEFTSDDLLGKIFSSFCIGK